MSPLILGIITMLVFVLLGIAMFLVGKYCKKKSLKIGLAIVIVLVILYSVIFSIDYNRVVSLKKPIFIVSKEMQDYKEYSKQIYKGLGYKVEIETKANNQISNATMYMFGKVIVCSVE